MPEFPDSSLEATKFLEDVTQLDGTYSSYVMLRDTSMMGTFKNLMEAINILAERGWLVVSTSVSSNNTMYIMLQNSHLKQKNRPDSES